jgi:hypothetical protein
MLKDDDDDVDDDDDNWSLNETLNTLFECINKTIN